MTPWATSSCITSSRAASSRRARSLAASCRGMSTRLSRSTSLAPTTMGQTCQFLRGRIGMAWFSLQIRTVDQSIVRTTWSRGRCQLRRTREGIQGTRIQSGNSMCKTKRTKVAKTKLSFKSRRTRGRSEARAMRPK